MQLHTVNDDNVVVEYFNHILPDSIEEKGKIAAEKGWKFLTYNDKNSDYTVIASIKEEHDFISKYLGSTRIIKKDINVEKRNQDFRKELILLVNETFNSIK